MVSWITKNLPDRSRLPADPRPQRLRDQPAVESSSTASSQTPAAWEDWARLGLVRVSHLRDLLSGPEHQHSSIRHPPPTLLAVMPASGRQLIQSQRAAALWLACPDPVERRVWSRTAEGHYQLSHTVSSTGALVPADDGAQAGQHSLPPATARDWGPGKAARGEPDPSSYAAWMRPSRQRPAPLWDRQVPALEPAVEPAQSQGPSSDTVDAAAPAAGQATPWAHVWRGHSHFPSRPEAAHHGLAAASRQALRRRLLTANPPRRSSRTQLPA